MCKVILPFHYRVFRCAAGRWVALRAATVYAAGTTPIDPDDVERHFGLSLGKIKLELFRLNGGRDGFYLGNLHERQYYYCGLEAEDVPLKLKELGVIAADPLER